MKTLVTIDHSVHVVLPKGDASAVIKALSGAIRVSQDFDTPRDRREWEVEEPIEINVQQVPDSRFKSKARPLDAAVYVSPARRAINGARRQLFLGEGA